MEFPNYDDDMMGEMENLQRFFNNPDDEYHENRHTSLQRSMVKLIGHTGARDHLLGESPTLRLVKACIDIKLEDVILAIEEGACITFQVCSKIL